MGRDDERAALEELTARALREDVPVAGMIHGDPGAGKSRLLAEAAATSPIRNHLRVTGYEPEQEIAFAAVRGLVRALADGSAEGRHLDALLFGTSAPIEPLQVFESVRRALDHLDATLLLVDDLHWVDQSTVALLHYLVRSAEQEGLPMALVATARPSPAVRSMAESLQRTLDDRFVSIVLGPLDRAAGIRMVRELAPHLDQREAAELWEKAAGVPFWLGLLATTEGTHADAGRVITTRLRGASEDAAVMLAVLVVAGRPVQEQEAAAVTGWPPDRARAAVAELVGAGLAVSAGEAVLPAHDLIRVAAATQIPASQLAHLNARFADRLEREAGDDPLLLLEALEHRHAGDLPAEELILRLVRSPRRRVLGREGLSRVVRLIDRADPGSSTASDLRVELATFASEVGEHRTALELWSALVERAPDPAVRARAALGASRAAYELEQREETWAYLQRVRTLASVDPTFAIEADALEATVLRWMDHRPDEARAAAERAVASARAWAEGDRMPAGTRTGYLHALGALTHAALQDDEPARMLEISEEIVGAARGFDELAYLRALSHSGIALFSLGRAAEADLRLRAAWREARSSYLHTAIVDTGFWFARALLAWGRVLEAEEVAGEVAALGQRVGFTSRQVQNWFYAARLSRGDWEAAAEALRREAAEEPDPHFRLALQLSLAAGLARLDASRAGDEVLSRLVAGREDAEAVGCRRCWGELILRGADALARAGHEERSARWIADWDGEHRPAYPLAAWRRRRAEASLAAARGSDEALPALEALGGEADSLGLRLEAVWAGIDMAAVVSPSGRERATALLTRAAETARSLGADAEVRVAEQALRGLGVRTWRRGAAGRGTEGLERLSERERQVARMVAAGASNPEIARTLFVSRKTVERHVSNILAKFDLRNRTELASTLGASLAESQDEGVPR